MTPPPVNEDYRDFLAALVARGARFLVVGAHALAAHGYPRSTVDIDVWIEASRDNAERVWRALADFGAPLADLTIREEDLVRPDVVIQLGLPPSRIDLLTGISGVVFDDAWPSRTEAREQYRVVLSVIICCIHVPRVYGGDTEFRLVARNYS